jgi:nicotinate-nucleotide pyrophosphorylase (carboxylating)
MSPGPQNALPAFPSGEWIDELVAHALAEDVGGGDATTRVAVPRQRRADGDVVVREAGVAAGLPLLARVYTALDPAIAVRQLVADGTEVAADTTVARVAGPAAALLTGERTALNFLQHLGGIATLTARYVAAVAGTRCRVLDTRKTLPGYRALAKYAVRCGGGENHRRGLFDRILFKDNHWVAARVGIDELVARARRDFPTLAIEIEVDTLAQLRTVLPLGVEWILLDNFTPADVASAVALRDEVGGDTLLEVSGNVDLATAATFARAGADAISVGRLTHSAPALDVALDLDLGERTEAPAP